MACSTCGTNGQPGCSRLEVAVDWLENMLPSSAAESSDIFEVKFKAMRKCFYQKPNSLEVYTGDLVVVEGDRGYDIGRVTMSGPLVQLQMRKYKVTNKDVFKLFRLATNADIEKLEESRSREYSILLKSREIISNLKLEMKLSEVELQADGTKAIFYYTADQRVDFRELIKQLAAAFHLRVEMRQIGKRQEAGIIGSVGSCGRALCCSTWLTDFKTVNTTAARYQNLSLNPTKLTGLCGRLKCCLNFELDSYLDAIKGIPQVREIHTDLGIAVLQKTDIFRRKMWFSYGGDTDWTALDVEQVIHIMQQNKEGIRPASLAELSSGTTATITKEPDFIDVVGQSSLHKRNSKKQPGFKKMISRHSDADRYPEIRNTNNA